MPTTRRSLPNWPSRHPDSFGHRAGQPAAVRRVVGRVILGGMKFQTTVLLGGKTATGLQIPDEVVAALGSGKRPKVVISIGSYSYRSTVALMGGKYLVPLSAEHRQASGLKAGDPVEVELTLDEAVREVELPAELAEALAQDAPARQFFDSLSFSYRKEWVRWITEAKKPETRQARLAKTLEGLRAGRRTH